MRRTAALRHEGEHRLASRNPKGNNQNEAEAACCLAGLETHLLEPGIQWMAELRDGLPTQTADSVPVSVWRKEGIFNDDKRLVADRVPWLSVWQVSYFMDASLLLHST